MNHLLSDKDRMQLDQARSPSEEPRKHGLDIVRAAAILSVMFYHAGNMHLLPASAPWFINFGWMGVDLFFVLSGFLIASQLLKPFASGSRPSYGQFFARRALRTLPAFSIVVLAYFAFPLLRETPDIQPFWQFMTFTENLLFDPSSSKSFDQFWSLCVEEQFYLLFPLAVAMLALRPSAHKVGAVLLGVLLFGIVLRSYLWLAFVAAPRFSLSGQTEWHSYVTFIYYPTWSRLDGLLAGVSIALLKTFRPNAWKRFVSRPDLLLGLGLAGILCAVTVFSGAFGPLASVALGFPLLSLSTALVVASASTGRALVGRYRIVGAEALAAGAYSLYLSHKIAFHVTAQWLAPSLGVSGGIEFLLSLAVAVAFGAALYWAVERPILALRRKLVSSACELGPRDDPHRLGNGAPTLARLIDSLRAHSPILPAEG